MFLSALCTVLPGARARAGFGNVLNMRLKRRTITYSLHRAERAAHKTVDAGLRVFPDRSTYGTADLDGNFISAKRAVQMLGALLRVAAESTAQLNSNAHTQE